MKKILSMLVFTCSFIFANVNAKLTFSSHNNTNLTFNQNCNVELNGIMVTQKGIQIFCQYFERFEAEKRKTPIYEMVDTLSHVTYFDNEYDYWMAFETAVGLKQLEVAHTLARIYINAKGNPCKTVPFYTHEIPSKYVKDCIIKQYFIMHKDHSVITDQTISFRELICSKKIMAHNSRLDVSNYHLSDISTLAVYFGMPGIRQIDLSNNELTFIPDNVCEFVDLTNLEMNNNKLTQVPSVIGTLANLRRLDLANNCITSLPNEICHSPSLWRLDVSGNQLTELPENLGKVTTLSWLWISNNPISALPESLKGLPTLYKLDTTRTLIES